MRRTKGICLMWSRTTTDFSLPHCLVGDKGIGKQLGTISSRHKRSAGRNLAVNRYDGTVRRSGKVSFAESFTALRNITARLVQQTLRTVSFVFLTLFVLRPYICSVHSNRSNQSNHSDLTLQCSLV